MWADAFLRAEQRHVLLLALWAGATLLGATVLALTLVAQRRASPLLARFATQLAAWGLVAALVAGLEWHGLHIRDVASATRVERLVWMRVGFDLGIVGMGGVLAVVGRTIARSPGAVGAGMAIIVHGLALFSIDVQFASSVSI